MEIIGQVMTVGPYVHVCGEDTPFDNDPTSRAMHLRLCAYYRSTCKKKGHIKSRLTLINVEGMGLCGRCYHEVPVEELKERE